MNVRKLFARLPESEDEQFEHTLKQARIERADSIYAQRRALLSQLAPEDYFSKVKRKRRKVSCSL